MICRFPSRVVDVRALLDPPRAPTRILARTPMSRLFCQRNAFNAHTSNAGCREQSSRPDEWCKPVDALKTGTVLLADPKAFTTNRYPK